MYRNRRVIHKDRSLKKICKNLVYNYTIAFLNFIFTIIASMAGGWFTNAAQLSNQNKLGFDKQISAVATGSGILFTISGLVGTIIDIIKGSTHLDKIRFKDNNNFVHRPSYSKLRSAARRVVPPITLVALSIECAGWLIDLSNEEATHLAQSTLYGISALAGSGACLVLAGREMQKYRDEQYNNFDDSSNFDIENSLPIPFYHPSRYSTLQVNQDTMQVPAPPPLNHGDFIHDHTANNTCMPLYQNITTHQPQVQEAILPIRNRLRPSNANNEF